MARNAATREAPRELGYFALSRTWTASALVALPVMVVYELGVRVVDGLLRAPVRNGADVILQRLVPFAGRLGTLAMPALVAIVLAALASRERGRGVALRRGVLPKMWAEAFVYALVFGGVVGRITALVLPPMQPGVAAFPAWAQVVLSFGAGFYEEVLFRGLVLGGLRAILGRFLEGSVVRDGAAVVVAALLFSAYHHVGPFGDPFTVQVFVFRFVAGLILSLLLVVRGFGITVATHALYDALLAIGL